MRRALAGTLVTVLFAACALPSTSELAGGGPAKDGGGPTGGDSGATADATSDASPGDGGSGADTGETSFVNLVKNPDFEDGSCGDVSFYQGLGGPSTDAHTGHGACQVCRAKESFGGYTFNPYVVLPNPTVGTRYVARAWVKLGPNSFKDQMVGIAVRTHANNPFALVEQAPSTGVPLTPEWTYLESTMVVTKPAETLDFLVYTTTAATAGERCFVIDDVAEGVVVEP